MRNITALPSGVNPPHAVNLPSQAECQAQFGAETPSVVGCSVSESPEQPSVPFGPTDRAWIREAVVWAKYELEAALRALDDRTAAGDIKVVAGIHRVLYNHLSKIRAVTTSAGCASNDGN